MKSNDVTFSASAIATIRRGLDILIFGFVIFCLAALMEGQILLALPPLLCIFGITVVKEGTRTKKEIESMQEGWDKEPILKEPSITEPVPVFYASEEVQPPVPPVAKKTQTVEKKVSPASPPKSAWTESIDWEEWVGQKLLQKLGIFIVLVGMIVFLKYSFDNGWIGPHGRIAISAMVACALLSAGEWFQGKYTNWFQAFTGGGLVLMYFTVWAAHVYYAGQLVFQVTPLMASVLYIAVTCVGALAAIRYKAQTIAWFTVIGGYTTPMLIEGITDPVGLVIYLSILAAGLLTLAWNQKWRYLNVAAFVMTQVYVWGKVYGLPVELFTDMQQIVVAVGFFCLFGLLPFLYQFRLGTLTEADDIFLTIANGLAVFIPVMDAVGGIDSQYSSLVRLALATVYLGYSALALTKITKDTMLINTYLVGAVILIALAIFVECTAEWVAAGWAPFSALLVYMSVRLQRTGPWRCAMLLLAGSIFYLAIQTPGFTPLQPEELWQPFTSAWSLQSYIVFASLLFWLKENKSVPITLIRKENKKDLTVGLHTVTALLLFVFITFNALAYGVPGIDFSIDIVLTMGHLVFAAIAIGAFVLTGSLVWFVAACMVQAFVLLSIFTLAETSGMLAYGSQGVIIPFMHPWSAVSVVAALMSGCMTYVALKRPHNVLNGTYMYVLLLGVILAQVWVHISVEIYHMSQLFEWSHTTFMRTLGVWWIVFAFTLRQWGIWFNKKTVAACGALLFLPVLLKDCGMLFADTTDMYEVVVWSVLPMALAIQSAKIKDVYTLKWFSLYFGIFAVLDSAIVGYTDFYHVMCWTIASMVMMLLGTRLKAQTLLLCGIVVLVAIAGIDMIGHLSSNSQGVLRTVWWAIIALGTISIGFSEKEQLVRKVGICLFFATTVKLLVFDFAILTAGIRILASITTGLMMIGASYLYQRFGTTPVVHKKLSK